MNQDMYWNVKVMKMQLMLRVLSTLDRLHFHSNPCRIFSHQNTLTLEFIASKWQLLHKHNLWTESRLEAIRGTCNTFLSWKLWYLVVREALPIWTFLLHHSYVNFLLDLDFLLKSNTFVPVNDSHSGLMRHTCLRMQISFGIFNQIFFIWMINFESWLQKKSEHTP